MVQAGAPVIISYHHNQAAVEATLQHITREGGKAPIFQYNVGSCTDIQALIDKMVHELGQIDILVNNSGMETHTLLLETTEEQFDLCIGIDPKRAFFCTQCAARQIIKQRGGGRIINVSSVHEDWPMLGNV